MRKIKPVIILSVMVMIMLLSGCANSGGSVKNGTEGQSDFGNIGESQHFEYESESKSESESEGESEGEETQAETVKDIAGETVDKTAGISGSANGEDKNEALIETTAKPKPTVPETEKNTVNAEPSANKTFVKTETETTTETVDYKYGVKKIITYENKYNVYSDGSKELVSSSNTSKYDVSGYNATDQQLKAESDSKASEYMSYYSEVLRLVNEIRAEAGVDLLTLDTTLCKAATMRAVEMNYSHIFSHTRPDGSSCFSVLGFYGISYGSAGENIAAGYKTPQKVVEGWKNSEGHYKNMINSSFKKLGVGLSKEETGGYNDYWVQLFSN